MKEKKQSLKSTKYKIIRNLLSKEFAQFLTGYSLLKRKTLDTLQTEKYISPFECILGWFGDTQVPNTYSHYGDIAMDTLLQVLRPVLEKKLKMKLVPTYSYQRIYKYGDILKKHVDRNSCEISITLNLGGENIGEKNLKDNILFKLFYIIMTQNLKTITYGMVDFIQVYLLMFAIKNEKRNIIWNTHTLYKDRS